MNEVKTIGSVGPRVVRIVDLKSAVNWHAVGLCRREIGADDLGRRMLVGKIYGPNTSAGADVKDVLRIRPYWGQVESVFEGQQKEMVSDVQGIVGLFIIWPPMGTNFSVRALGSTTHMKRRTNTIPLCMRGIVGCSHIDNPGRPTPGWWFQSVHQHPRLQNRSRSFHPREPKVSSWSTG